MDKRGQFFLVAAIIIVGVLMGLTAVVNQARTGNDPAHFYDFGREVGFETKKIIDYGVYNERDTLNLTERFLEDYANYIAREEAIFLIGDKTDITALHFNSSQSVGSVGIQLGGGVTSVPIQAMTGRRADVERIGENLVRVTIDGIGYEFELREGQNFYFVMIKTEDGERFVSRG
jgi:hypothetical protein